MLCAARAFGAPSNIFVHSVTVAVGIEALIDAITADRLTFIRVSHFTGAASGTLPLSNIKMDGTTTAIATTAADVVLAGSDSIDLHAIDNVYSAWSASLDGP